MNGLRIRVCGLTLASMMGLCSFGSALPAIESNSAKADEQALKQAGLSTETPALLEFFRKRTLTETGQAQIKELVRQLGAKPFRTRARASAELVTIGSLAIPYLRQAEHDSDPEIARRAEDCLRHIGEDTPPTGIGEAAARLLAARKPAEATAVLLAYEPFAVDEMVAKEVHSSLAALALRDGKLDEVLIASLDDKIAAHRAAAAEALCQAGLAAKVPAVKKRLRDEDVQVRLRTARALTLAHDKEAIPVLIELLTELPAAKAWEAEDLLERLAGEQAPPVLLGHDEAARRRCQEAWASWWKQNAAKVDLSQAQGIGPPMRYTLLVFLNAGRVLELDEHDQPRFEVTGLDLPLDAQMLPNDHVLVAEHDGNRITERDRNGAVVWEYRLESPLMAQRLPNGHTFMASMYRLMEVDRQGKEVFTYTRPGGEPFMKAIKLPNGEIAFITMLKRFIRLDPTGKEMQNIGANVSTSGGRIEALPGGRVLIPERTANRVAEYDAEGKLVWQALYPEPVAAVRLPNGHTLVTSYSQTRAVELDRAGKQVWEFQANTRVTRAFRR
jgi:HEAT repeat protein